jgi:Protein of unknown function (DUF3352)
VAFVAGRFLGRVPSAVWGGLRSFWLGLSGEGRRRFAAALGAAVALLLLLGVAVPNLPCEFPGGDSCPPPDDAQELVPSDALAYAHVDLDPDSEQYEQAGDVAASLPTITGEIVRRALALLAGPRGTAPDFARDLEPWLGDEAAIAALPVHARVAQQIDLLEIGDPEGAARFAASLASGRPQTDVYRDVEVSVDDRGLATAQLDGFLVIGTEAGVRTVIDTKSGEEGAESLADDDAASEARDALPDDRFLDAYVSADGARDLAAPAGPLGSFSPLLSPDAAQGAAAALAADDGELELSVRSVLDPDRARSRPGFFAALDPFDPSLASRLSPDALAYLGIGNPGSAVTALLAQATAATPGIATGFEDLVDELRRSDEIDVEKDFLPALGDEAAFALEPRLGGVEADPTPYLQFIADDVDSERAEKALGSLQRPVAAATDPQTGLRAPSFQATGVAGVEARSMQISSAIELTYAVFDGLATVATSVDGIARLAEGDDGLDESERYERATDGYDDEPSLLAYFDLGELIAVGELLGLAEDPAYATFASEFRTLEALGLAVESGEEMLATDARLIVGPPAEQSTEEEEVVPQPSD